MRVVLVLLLAVVSGCATVQRDQLPKVDPEKIAIDNNISSVVYNVKVLDPDGIELPAANGIMVKDVNDVLAKSKIFKNITQSTENKGHYLEFEYQLKEKLGPGKAALLGAIQGATFFIVPVFYTQPWELHVKIYENGSLSSERTYRDEVRTWIHLLLIFAIPFYPPDEEARDMLKNMAANYLSDQYGVPRIR